MEQSLTHQQELDLLRGLGARLAFELLGRQYTPAANFSAPVASLVQFPSLIARSLSGNIPPSCARCPSELRRHSPASSTVSNLGLTSRFPSGVTHA
jgi:hypothetical protein